MKGAPYLKERPRRHRYRARHAAATVTEVKRASLIDLHRPTRVPGRGPLPAAAEPLHEDGRALSRRVVGALGSLHFFRGK